MESQKPILGSTESTQQNPEGFKTDSSGVYNAPALMARLENRLGDGGAREEVPESAEAEAVRLKDMAQNIGGLTLPAEVEDPRI